MFAAGAPRKNLQPSLPPPVGEVLENKAPLCELSIQLNDVGANLYNVCEKGKNDKMVMGLYKESISTMMQYLNPEQESGTRLLSERVQMLAQGDAMIKKIETMRNQNMSKTRATAKSKRSTMPVQALMYQIGGHPDTTRCCCESSRFLPALFTEALTAAATSPVSLAASADQFASTLYNIGLAQMGRALQISMSNSTTREQLQRSSLLMAAQRTFEMSLNISFCTSDADEVACGEDDDTVFLQEEGKHFLSNSKENKDNDSGCHLSLAAVNSLNNLGYLHYQHGSYEEAVSCYQEAFSRLQEYCCHHPPGKNVMGTAELSFVRTTILINLGRSHCALGDFDDAAEVCLDAHNLLLQRQHEQDIITNPQKHNEKDDADLLLFFDNASTALLYNLGLLKEAQCDWDQAAEYYKRYLRRIMSDPSSEDPSSCNARSLRCCSSHDVIVGLNRLLAIQRGHSSDLGQATKVVQKLWETDGCNALNLSLFLHQIGLILYGEGQQDVFALMYFREALRLEMLTLGPHHTRLAQTLNNVGQSYQKLGLLDEAMEAYDEALAMFPSSPLSSMEQGQTINIFPVILYNTGIIEFQRGHNDRASQAFNEALALQRFIVDNATEPQMSIVSDHGTMLYNVASALREMGHTLQSLARFKESLDIRKAALGTNHVLVAESLYQIGRLNHRLGDNPRALQILQETARIERVTLGPFHSDLAVTLHYIAQIHSECGEFQNALDVYREVLAIVRHDVTASPESDSTPLSSELMPSNILLAMASIHANLGRTEDMNNAISEAVIGAAAA